MRYILLSTLSFLFFGAFAQFKNSTKDLPKAQSPEELNNMAPIAIDNNNLEYMAMPNGLIVPAEWEEVQAVSIQWPYPSFYYEDKAILYAKLANAIQQATKVWIMVENNSDTNSVKSMMAQNGVTLYNHTFMVKSTYDAFWSRDSGPWGFYYGTNDDLGFIDTKYYSTRPNDDNIPAFLANKIGVLNYYSKVRFEGGNFMVDGFGHGFYSTRMLSNNASVSQQFPTWTFAQTKDTMQTVFNLSQVTEVDKLVCDGGTGHIDMYLKLLDEQTLVVSEYPSQVTAQDRATIESNYNLLKTLTNVYGRPYKIHRMPMATQDDGSLSISCNDIDNDARGFVNGVFVNKTFIFPIFSDQSSGYVAGDSAAVQLYRKLLPGYKIVPIDARWLSPMGGAIHCITMQIPAFNPVRFWHPSIEGLQPLMNNYHILSKITNKSGIANAKCMWRKKGGNWNASNLSDSAGYFVGTIPNQSFGVTDTIEYYIDANSNNGKHMTKPIVAPDGYYQFYFDPNTLGVSDLFQKYDNNHLFAAYPNPASHTTQIKYYTINNAKVQLHLFNTVGQQVLNTELMHTTGLQEISLNTSSLQPGVYFYSLFVNDVKVATRKLVIQ